MVSSNEPSFSADLSTSLNPALFAINEDVGFVNTNEISTMGNTMTQPNILGSIKKGY